MSRRIRARRDEGGFTLVEVIAAMGIFSIVAAAATAMFAAGLRASVMTKMDTTAKNLSQQRFEAVRNLPFHIDQLAAGTNPPDLLDTYYVNNSGSAGRGVQGYVPAGATRWTADGDPATGAFYRYVQAAVPGYTQYKQYVATQFLNDSGTAIAPTGTFNTQVYSQDVPPSATVGVGVTTFWTAAKVNKVHRTYTQITSGRPSPPSAVFQSRMTALRLSGGLSLGESLTLDIAALTSDGAKSTSVSSAMAARGATAAIAGGSSVSGVTTTAQAPPDSGALSGSAGPRTLTYNGNTYATFGSTSTAGVLAGTSTGQPLAASTGTPGQANLLGSGAGANVATFAIDSTAPARLALLATHAFVADAACGGGCSNVGVTGSANSTVSGTTHSVNASSSATVRGTLALLPTTYAPNGLIRIKLTSATVSCSVTRTGSATPVAAAAVTYSGTVSYFAPTAPGNVGGYVTVDVNSSQLASPLTAALLSSTRVATDSAGQPIYLSDYFASWSSLYSASAAASKTLGATGTTAAASVSGVIGVTTIPLREDDDTSAVGATVGLGSCDAEDYR
jgi:prepilin-type N-terminal cleavage/methylation domain-containing protein